MKKGRTAAAVILMLVCGLVGSFLGAFLYNAVGGAILGVLTAGIACIVYTIDNSGGPEG